MKIKEIILPALLVIGLVLIGSLALNRAPAPSYSASIQQAPIITSGVYAVTATSTNQFFDVQEITGSMNAASVNSRATVTSTVQQILAPNSGRVYAVVCNEGSQTGWIGYGSSVTSTVGASGYFATSTGRLVPSGACVHLTP